MRPSFSNPRFALVSLLLIYLSTGVYLSVVTPLGDTPDENAHFFYVEYLLKNHSFPALHPEFYQTEVHEAHQPPTYYLLGALLVSKIPDTPILRLYNNPNFKWDTPVPTFLAMPTQAFPWHGPFLAWHLLRFLSLAFGFVAILLVYLTALAFFGRNKQWEAIACAAFVGLNPQVIFILSACSNDCLTVFAGALLTLTTIQLARRPTLAQFGWTSLAVAFVALSKVNVVLMLPMLGPVALFAWLRLPNRRHRMMALLLVTLVPIAIAGWWYVRSVRIYGDLSGIAMMKRTFNYGPPLSPRQWFVQIPDAFWWTFVTAWGGFGWERMLLPSWIAAIVLVLCLVPLEGLARRWRVLGWWPNRRGADNDPALRWIALGFALGLLALVGGFLSYHRLLGASSAWSGRRFYPALAIFAIAWVAGWHAILYGKERGLAWATIAGNSALILYSIFFIVRPAYAPPPMVAEDFKPQRPAAIRYGDDVEFLGYDWQTENHDGQRVTLYWRRLRDTFGHYHAALDLGDQASSPTMVQSLLEVRYPISYWPLGRIVAEPFAFKAPADWSKQATLRVEEGFFDRHPVAPVESATSRTLAQPVIISDK